MTGAGYREASRVRKAERLVAVIDAHVRAAAPDLPTSALANLVARAQSDWWAKVAVVAGTRPPSEETRNEAIAIYVRRVRAEEALRQSVLDAVKSARKCAAACDGPAIDGSKWCAWHHRFWGGEQ